ncbi:MAG: TM0106 family RecB-like putative nuclease [Acidobacteria bacterium]|nr:TM0106 family RecB-like putative nuclease [Acidobacteriota bacterium]
MRLLGDRVLLATSDLTTHVRCEHATYLERGTTSGEIEPLAKRPPSAMTEVIVEKGKAHERAYVETLRAAGHRVVDLQHPAWTIDGLRRAEEETLAAMRSGADFIYQASFFDGRWQGYPDLLRRIERPSSLGGWSYEVLDTKFSHSVKPHFLLQLSDYSAHVARLQDLLPDEMHVILGTNHTVSFPVDAFGAYYRHVRKSLDDFAAREQPPIAYPVEFCALCEWLAHCRRHWNEIDHLSLVANIRRSQVTRLERNEIPSLAALGDSARDRRVPKLSAESFASLQHQAQLQLQHRRTGVHTFELLLPVEKGRGFLRLPEPHPGDIFLDFEGDPFLGDGLTFLFGAVTRSEYRCGWAHDAASEAIELAKLMDFLVAREPGAHIYHYGALEVATLKRLAIRHGTRERELDDLLRQEAFVDLAAVVRQAMRISHSGYGLKKVETFYFNRKEEGVADAGGAVLAYETWLQTRDSQLLASLAKYNEEDCRSIVGMQQWLASIRPEGVDWRAAQEPEPQKESRIEEDQRNDALHQQLRAGGAEELLLAQLLYYHRREERPGWWWFHERKKMGPDELRDDGEAIADLKLDPNPPVPVKKSKIFTYTFPAQEHKFRAGDDAFDAANGEKVGSIESIDDATGTLLLRRTPATMNGEPQAIIPKPKTRTEVLRDAVRRFAEAALEKGFDGMPFRAGVDVLFNRAPRVLGLDPGAPIQPDNADLTLIADIIRRLDSSYLFIQGPPGSGKTYFGARVIVQLLRAGKRVGVTSSSHAAIHNLLEEIEKVAHEEGFWFRGLKKANEESTRFVSKLSHPMIESSSEKNEAFADPAVPLIAGTAWLFSDAALEQSVDYLFIDEAGQVPLANTIAICTATRNLVLLGDPLQLAQVSQAPHPDGAGASVLEHLLGKQSTVPRDRGIFLEHTWRMHSAVCGFVSEVIYASRLRSAEECERQAVTVDGVVETGLHFLAVEHEGNSQSSDEEAECLAAEVRRMLRGTFTDAKGKTRKLAPCDFLVVAAYNAQVRHLLAALRAAGLHDVPVGTVDKFQGKQAAVVFFSMATSSAAELPRDIEFLFSRNRLNVAVSRARCVATVIANPRLLDVPCKSVEQMRLVNGLCRFVEMATRG